MIERVGGAKRMKSCGQPVSLLGFQSTVAWEVGLNVGNVGYRPGRSIARGTPIVVFKPHAKGWQVRPYNLPKRQGRRLQRHSHGLAVWLRRSLRTAGAVW